MAEDIAEGDTETVRIEGGNAIYILVVNTGNGMEVGVFRSNRFALTELKDALHDALGKRREMILLRAGTYMGAIKRWQSLDPGVFAKRLTRH